MRFSVVLIARNEAKTLPRLLSSLKDFSEKGGEIILVDTGSTDDTANVARAFGCKVEEVGDRFKQVLTNEHVDKINNHFVVEDEETILKYGDSLFDFASARNYAASLASNDMVAMPDCDELYTKLDLDKIEEVIISGAEQLEYNFVFSHDQFGNEAIKFMHSKFYNRTKLQWKGIVHEVLSGEAKRQYLDESIIKLEHYQNHETNRTGYLKGLALDCFLNPTNDRNSHYFARELLWVNRPKSAIKELKRHISMNAWQPERAQSMVYLGDAYKQLGSEECVDWYLKSFITESGRREPLMRLCQYYFEKNDPQKVASFAKAALEIPISNFYANNADDYADKPHAFLHWSLYCLGRRDEALYHFNISRQYKPLLSKYLFEYRYFYELPKVTILIPTLGRPEGLQKCLESIKRLNYPQELIEVQCEEDEPRLGVPKRVKKLYEQSSGDVLVFASNDTEFTENCLIHAVIESKEHGLVALNTGPVSVDEGNICEHFLIRRDIVEKIGEIFDTDFFHVGVDNLLWAKCKKIGEAFRSNNAIMIHNHFSKTKSQTMDSVAKLGWSNADADRELLKKKLAEL